LVSRFHALLPLSCLAGFLRLLRADQVHAIGECLAGDAQGGCQLEHCGERRLADAEAVVVYRSKRKTTRRRQLCFTESSRDPQFSEPSRKGHSILIPRIYRTV